MTSASGLTVDVEGRLEDMDDRSKPTVARTSGKARRPSGPPSSSHEPSSSSSHPLVELLRNASDGMVGQPSTSNNMPPGSSLLHLLSPFRRSFEDLGFLGRGGFGSVIRGRHILDGRLCAIKRIPFRSPVAPWAQSADLEKGSLLRLLREVRSLCKMEKSPHVTRYYWAWTEPDFQKLSGVLARSHSDVWRPTKGGPGALEGDDSHSDSHADDESESSERSSSDVDGRGSSTSSFTAAVPPTPSQSYGITFSDSTVTATTEDLRPPAKRGPSRKVPVPRGGVLMPPAPAPRPAPAKPDPPAAYIVEEMSTSVTAAAAVDSDDEGSSRSASDSDSDSDTDSVSSGGKELIPVMLPADGKDYPYYLFISMECVEGPTLDRWMAARPRVPLTHEAESEIAICKQLLRALLHIHMHGLIHRDIKPNNIFVVGEGSALRVVIGDFGLAALIDGTSGSAAQPFEAALPTEALHRTTHIGTATYCAPEQMQGPGLYGCRVDLFPVGLILVELFTKMGTGMERARILQDARNGFLPALLYNLYPEVGDLATRLLFSDPGSRITALQALNHPALNGRIYEGDVEEVVVPPAAGAEAAPHVTLPGPTPSTRSQPAIAVANPTAAAAAAAAPIVAIEELSGDSQDPTAARPFPPSPAPADRRDLLPSLPSPSALRLNIPGALPADPFENGPVFALCAAEWPRAVVLETCRTAHAIGCHLAVIGASADAENVAWGAQFRTLVEARESLAPSTTWRVALQPPPSGASAASAKENISAPVASLWPWELVAGCFDGRNVLLVLSKDACGAAPIEMAGAPPSHPAARVFGRFVSLRTAHGEGLGPSQALAGLWSASQALRTSVSRATLSLALSSSTAAAVGRAGTVGKFAPPVVDVSEVSSPPLRASPLAMMKGAPGPAPGGGFALLASPLKGIPGAAGAKGVHVGGGGGAATAQARRPIVGMPGQGQGQGQGQSVSSAGPGPVGLGLAANGVAESGGAAAAVKPGPAAVITMIESLDDSD